MEPYRPSARPRSQYWPDPGCTEKENMAPATSCPKALSTIKHGCQSQGKGSNLKGAILDQMLPKSLDFDGFQFIFINFVWIWMDLDLDLDGFASPARSSVCCSPAGGLFFQKKHVPGVFAA